MPEPSSSDAIAGIPGAPAIPGLTFRGLGGGVDFRMLADVIQRSRDADLFESVDTPEDLADEFQHLQNCDPGKDMLLVEVKGTAIGHCRCEWHTRPGNLRTYEHCAYLLPEWRKTGLRRAMLRENERRLREIADEHPKDSAKTFETRTNFAENDWKSLLEEEGYRPFRHNLEMVRPNLDAIPDFPIPEGMEIRPVRPEDLRTIFDAAREAFRDEPHFAEEYWSEESLKSLLEWRAFRPEIWLVAWAGDEVAGGVMNIIDDEDNAKYKRNWGHTAAIFVGRSFRKRGLASALIARSLEVLMREGADEAALGVDSENPSGARRLYERMGFRLFQQYSRYRKPLD